MLKKNVWKTMFGLIALLGLIIYCVSNNVRVFLVLTGSMDPVIPAKSLVFSRKTDTGKVQKGRVIIFYDQENQRITAHRVERGQDGGYITKGDVNSYHDRYIVKPKDILGQVIGVFTVDSLWILLLQLVLLALVFVLGVLLKRFLLFLFRYG